MNITNIEIDALVSFFNQGGYVLDFSTADFDAFTYQSVGVRLCSKYRCSKGKSLISYINEANDSDKLKLLNDLMQHYELSSQKEYDEQYNETRTNVYEKCRAILDKARDDSFANVATKGLKQIFNSDYITSQIDLMVKMKDSNPTEAIGKSKELIESCCKTILQQEGCQIENNWDITRLVDETFKHFNIMPKNISDEIKGAKSIKAILGNLKAISQGVAELRNLYGSGHGKSSSYKGLEPRHASLAIGSSMTLVRFLWDSYERCHKQK